MIVTVAEADTYFATRLGASAWTVASSGTKTAALQTAENDLSLYYTLVSDNDLNKRAVMEQALFRLLDLGIDRRAAVQAQGVQSAGVVAESYAGRFGRVPICGYARQILGTPDGVAVAGELTREDE